jgi:hypothetical protein
MTSADLFLLTGLIVALAVSVGNFRAWGWLLAAAASYAVSTVYWRTGLPYGAFIAGMCDALLCLAVYFVGRLKWEMWVWRVFQLSVLVNFVYLGGTLQVWPVFSHDTYSIVLEAINWIALLWIGGHGAVQAVGASDDATASGVAWRRVYRALLPLYRERKDAPFYKAARKWTS